MNNLRRETEASFQRFLAAWRAELNDTIAFYDDQEERCITSYRRITSLQAWRTIVLDGLVPSDALSFFLEAQNDAVCSHVLARMGAFRAALKCLRSVIENVLGCLYYQDHLVELQLWKRGKHRLDFQAYLRYFGDHPIIRDHGKAITGMDALENEYATLSRAVHASATAFRMTGGSGETRLWLQDSVQLAKWGTRERIVLREINKLLIAFFSEHLQGAAHTSLRKSISFAVSKSNHAAIRTSFGVRLFS